MFAVAALGATASSASADDVWLWACHGPNGQPLPALGQRATPFGPAAADCTSSTGLRAAGTSGWVFDMPFDAPLSQVKINRNVTLGSGATYRLRADSVALETAAADSPLSGERTFDASG